MPTAIPANAFCTLAVSIRSRRAGVSRSVGEAILSGSVADVSFGYRGGKRCADPTFLSVSH